MHTSTPSFPTDAGFAELLKQRNPNIVIGMVGAKVAVDPEGSLLASQAIDFVAREEFDYTCKEIAEGLPFDQVLGISFRLANGTIKHNAARPMIENMDQLPFVAPVYKRDLTIKNYFLGYLHHPYLSFYTGRGCKSRCTFCLWPQTVGGHNYRTRSAESVIEEVKWIKTNMPEVKEIMFDDDTFTDLRPRAEEIARGLGKLGVMWSCNAKANVPYSTLKIMKDNGLHLLLVGYESGDDQILLNIKKGLGPETARRFSDDCRKLGIVVHGTFILGLPGETKETIAKTIAFAKEINPHTLQVFPGSAVSRHSALPAGGGKQLDCPEQCRQAGQRQRGAVGDHQLPAFVEGGDLPRRRNVLQKLLFPSHQDLGNRPRNARQLGHAEAPFA